MEDNKNNKCFNLYYLNISKVYELSMMINNVIKTSISKENNQLMKNISDKKRMLNGSFGIDSQYLANIKSTIEDNSRKELSNSSKIIEKLDIKTTKSILLNEIKKKCIELKNIDDCHEGDLIKIDNIKLEIYDRETLQQMLLLKRNALKGIKIEGLDINNIISSLIKDYSYILIGKIENSNENIIIKIPFELDNEFENNYNVDDVLLGRVSIIGIYKGINKISNISSNTYNNIINNNNNLEENSKVIDSNVTKTKKETKDKTDNSYSFIDVIAIIQEVNFKNNEIQDIKHKCIFNRILSFFKRTNK